ncbi:hypothetical protein HUG10_20035 (plasmid) [Halorarum halophilum]|uniref:Universal stress protein family protein n=1 Tax=Halorarum halophilum TaxID=2743090 RepID=A0A7D5K3U3_9EURY|nr:hypothetical protein [Halobaculum halophilum]QLG29901.1 hypothetical protein HUG10_20035 [Halobaculum halophilum]
MAMPVVTGGEHESDDAVTVGNNLASAFDDELVVLHVLRQEYYDALLE